MQCSVSSYINLCEIMLAICIYIYGLLNVVEVIPNEARRLGSYFLNEIGPGCLGEPVPRDRSHGLPDLVQ